MPGALDVTGSGGQGGGKDYAYGHARGAVAAVPQPLQQQRGAEHQCQIELRDEAVGIAGHIETEVVMAQHVERKEEHQPADE